MKRIVIITLQMILMLQSFSQEVTAVSKSADQKAAADTNAAARVIVGDNALVVENNKDAFKMRIGDRGISILESLENKGPKFEFEKYDAGWQDDQEEKDEDKKKKGKHFKGHWSGIEFGLNNYVTSDYSLNLPASIDYMSLHSGKSINFNLNLPQVSLGITRHFGFVTGLGFNWNNYRFDGNNNIQKGTNDIIEEYDPGAMLKKSKLATLYINVPLLAEIQIHADNNYLNIAAGAVGAVKLLSHSKMVFEDGDKVKSDGDFSLNMLRYGATARVGYGNFQIYGTYYFSPLFRSGKTPGGIELYPFEIGIAFAFND
jgi:hypothetical protein